MSDYNSNNTGGAVMGVLLIILMGALHIAIYWVLPLFVLATILKACFL